MNLIDALALITYRTASAATRSRRISRSLAAGLRKLAIAANRRQREDAEQALARTRLAASFATDYQDARAIDAAWRVLRLEEMGGKATRPACQLGRAAK